MLFYGYSFVFLCVRMPISVLMPILLSSRQKFREWTGGCGIRSWDVGHKFPGRLLCERYHHLFRRRCFFCGYGFGHIYPWQGLIDNLDVGFSIVDSHLIITACNAMLPSYMSRQRIMPRIALHLVVVLTAVDTFVYLLFGGMHKFLMAQKFVFTVEYFEACLVALWVNQVALMNHS